MARLDLVLLSDFSIFTEIKLEEKARRVPLVLQSVELLVLFNFDETMVPEGRPVSQQSLKDSVERVVLDHLPKPLFSFVVFLLLPSEVVDIPGLEQGGGALSLGYQLFQAAEIVAFLAISKLAAL